MAAGTPQIYQGFWKRLGQAQFNFGTHTVGCALFTSAYTPDATTQEVLADLTGEVAAGNGYPAGGTALTNPTWTELGTTRMVLNADNTVFTASGGSIVARYYVLYNASTTGSPLFGYGLLDTTPADVTITAGNQLVLNWHDTNGIFYLPT